MAAPDDSAGFAACLHRVLSNPSHRMKLAAEARAFAMDWSAATRARELVELYRSLLAT